MAEYFCVHLPVFLAPKQWGEEEREREGGRQEGVSVVAQERSTGAQSERERGRGKL